MVTYKADQETHGFSSHVVDATREKQIVEQMWVANDDIKSEIENSDSDEQREKQESNESESIIYPEQYSALAFHLRQVADEQDEGRDDNLYTTKDTKGVLQGDTLAPYLFVIALDYALHEATKEQDLGFSLTMHKSSRYPATFITDADFADDLALISNNLNQVQTLLHNLEEAAGEIGLHINHKKTEFMIYNQPCGDLLTQSGNKLKQVDNLSNILALGFSQVKKIWRHASD
eukprot:gene15881-7213_t